MAQRGRPRIAVDLGFVKTDEERYANGRLKWRSRAKKTSAKRTWQRAWLTDRDRTEKLFNAAVDELSAVIGDRQKSEAAGDYWEKALRDFQLKD